MEHFEGRALIFLSSTPGEWKRYVDDIFAKWGHGKEKLNDFLAHLNSLSEHIKFTLEIELDNQLPFIVVLLTKKEDESCGYQVYWKKNTQTYTFMQTPTTTLTKISTLSRLSRLEH